MRYLDRLDPNAGFVALDVETTGRSTRLDVVTEIGAIRYHRGVEIGRMVTLVKPATSMLPWVARITGITDEMLAGAPPASSVARRLLKFLGRSPIVAHSAAFDVPILEHFLTRHARPVRSAPDGQWRWFAPPVMCTLRLSRRILPHLSSKRLQAVAEYLDFVPRRIGAAGTARFHRAGMDAEAAAHVFFCLSTLKSRKGVGM